MKLLKQIRKWFRKLFYKPKPRTIGKEAADTWNEVTEYLKHKSDVAS